MRNLFRRFSWLGGTLALAALAATPAAAVGAVPVKTLVIDKIDPLSLTGHDEAAPADGLYYSIDTRYPKAWMNKAQNTFKLTVDGKPAPWEAAGGGFSGDDANAAFRIYLSEAGKKTVSVALILGGKTITATKEVEVKGAPVLRLLDWIDGEGVFENVPLRFVLYEVKNLAVKINGKDVAAETRPLEAFAGIYLATVAPSLVPGTNKIEFSAVDTKGAPVASSATLLYIANNTVKLGDKFSIVYGAMGSRSGPFYSIKSDGEALDLSHGSSWKSRLVASQPGKDEASSKLPWIFPETVNAFPAIAQKAGKSTLTFYVKSNFMYPEKEDKKLEITVAP